MAGIARFGCSLAGFERVTAWGCGRVRLSEAGVGVCYERPLSCLISCQFLIG
jgi:hypothetical protein